MQLPRKIELLAPARDLETAIAAINHGADAIYIGAERFGARVAAGNSIGDIAKITGYAHIFGVKVYVTINTIIYDDEIAAAERLIRDLYEIGVDALIIQDMAIAGMDIPPMPLHASTQMDNRTAEKVKYLSAIGFPRVVLARELSLEQIKEIHTAVPDTELEVFVHGALCVSYSGQCYASQHCFGRSANRGKCAQFCRLPFSLVDSEGTEVVRDKHLLSLKDMNRSDRIEDMLDAGVASFKIEGRLKDISYVKNITAYYRNRLDEIFARRKEYLRSSAGKVFPQFTPAPEKSFNRGFTDYMLNGDKNDIASFDTPKSKGEYVGKVKFVSRSFFTITGSTLNNGDGACFVAKNGKLCGFRINRVEGNRVFPQSMPPIESGDELFRNYDIEFERRLARPDNPRRLSVEFSLTDTPQGFLLHAKSEAGVECSIEQLFNKEVARSSQNGNIITQLKKCGNTPFDVESVNISFEKDWFVPSSLLSEMRRSICDKLTGLHIAANKRIDMRLNSTFPYIKEELTYLGNVANDKAKEFYKAAGVKEIAPAFELRQPEGATLMFCKHCIKKSMGWCSKDGKRHGYKEPFYLLSADGKRFRLVFDCNECVMKVEC